MTHVGKILVLVIMAFSLVFLGISTVVFMTSKNWRDETKKKTEEVQKVKKKLDEAQAIVDAAKKELGDAQAAAQQQKQTLDQRLHALEDSNKRDVDQITAAQERMTHEITKLQAVEQYVLYKNSEPPPRSDPAPALKHVPRLSQASTGR